MMHVNKYGWRLNSMVQFDSMFNGYFKCCTYVSQECFLSSVSASTNPTWYCKMRLGNPVDMKGFKKKVAKSDGKRKNMKLPSRDLKTPGCFSANSLSYWLQSSTSFISAAFWQHTVKWAHWPRKDDVTKMSQSEALDLNRLQLQGWRHHTFGPNRWQSGSWGRCPTLSAVNFSCRSWISASNLTV